MINCIDSTLLAILNTIMYTWREIIIFTEVILFFTLVVLIPYLERII